MDRLRTTLDLSDLLRRAARQPVRHRRVHELDTRCETCHGIVPAGEVLVFRAGGWVQCEPCSLTEVPS
jgi:hypothetical protein